MNFVCHLDGPSTATTSFTSKHVQSTSYVVIIKVTCTCTYQGFDIRSIDRTTTTHELDVDSLCLPVLITDLAKLLNAATPIHLSATVTQSKDVPAEYTRIRDSGFFFHAKLDTLVKRSITERSWELGGVPIIASSTVGKFVETRKTVTVGRLQELLVAGGVQWVLLLGYGMKCPVRDALSSPIYSYQPSRSPPFRMPVKWDIGYNVQADAIPSFVLNMDGSGIVGPMFNGFGNGGGFVKVNII